MHYILIYSVFFLKGCLNSHSHWSWAVASVHMFVILICITVLLLFFYFQEFLPEYFSEWNTLAKSMHVLVTQKELRKAVDKVHSCSSFLRPTRAWTRASEYYMCNFCYDGSDRPYTSPLRWRGYIFKLTIITLNQFCFTFSLLIPCMHYIRIHVFQPKYWPCSN